MTHRKPRALQDYLCWWWTLETAVEAACPLLGPGPSSGCKLGGWLLHCSVNPTDNKIPQTTGERKACTHIGHSHLSAGHRVDCKKNSSPSLGLSFPSKERMDRATTSKTYHRLSETEGKSISLDSDLAFATVGFPLSKGRVSISSTQASPVSKVMQVVLQASATPFRCFHFLLPTSLRCSWGKSCCCHTLPFCFLSTLAREYLERSLTLPPPPFIENRFQSYTIYPDCSFSSHYSSHFLSTTLLHPDPLSFRLSFKKNRLLGDTNKIQQTKV